MLFNHTERIGILTLLVLITGFIILPRYFREDPRAFFLLPENTITINDSTIVKNDSNRTAVRSPKSPSPSIELNTADSSSLVKIRGIGPYYASKIINYRKRLGGYHSVQQLKELKLTYLNIDSCMEIFKVNPAKIKKHNLDTMSFKAILRHPYLDYEDVQMIFNAKRKYDSLSYRLLEEKKILPAYKLKKIKPYFQ